MRTLKSLFGVGGALLPVLYCGGLIYYFVDLSGSLDEAATDGLGPTVLGLGAVGLLFCIPLMIKVVRLFARPRPPGSPARGGTDASTPGGEKEFDADAVLARYMARQSAQAAANATAAPTTPESGGPANGTGFGRRIR
ncbi:MAG: hypothetical protein K8S25_14715 [Alphaproteobacteria bacterium]|nr:hypothetical protein [Alphaproteobacteria bacterium]